MRIVKNFVNGAYEEPTGEVKYPVYNPAFGEKIAMVAEAKRDEVDRAVDLAFDAQKKWSEIPIPDRVKILFKLETLMWDSIEEIAEITTIEHGKTFEEARGDAIRAIQNVESAAAATYHIMGSSNKDIASGVDEELIREPLGVFAIISPFNFPLMIPFWFLPYAVALGNTVVVKPSEKTPLSMEKSMELIKKAGFPDNVIQLLNGGKEAVEYILENKKIAGISFVGSTPVAEYVYKKGTSLKKRVQAGASAKNFILVMPDADLEKNIKNIIGSFFGNAGERCLAGAVLVTFEENHDSVVKKFVDAARELRIGYGMEKDVDMGPLIREEHRSKVKEYIESGINEGAKILLDGRKYRNERYPNGFFLGPTVFDYVTEDMRIAREEIFGPVASVIKVDNFDHAIEMINRSRYGNASSIYTSSGYYAREYVKRIKAGNVGVNIGVAAPIAFYPFAGMKDSFFGDLHPQGGLDHILFFTDSKVVISRW
ncbi:MAG: CoA-acylating methylmalonate-semialdehyde dehydrogenase [Thermoplasmata archaeon]|jgi:malonate-semialdehyde dehydrogenase (acetylating)/methylmalonate-semialdehyde dehydrogenase|nr:CoA-acylating methylmalonate-semialdehyde dehydrogenase [Euryarchaeota archaeon]MVT36361.1 CoA-acylating methylmalonate-semialdehyde dehydrogenase [Euryarchaeota archaeon]